MRLNTVLRQRLRPGFTAVVPLGLGCLFLYSSLPKVRQLYGFLSSVYNYEMVGPKSGVLVAVVLPWLELLVGICLVGGIFVGGALTVSIAMGATFTFAIASALYRGLNISCGCFSASSAEQIGYATLMRACAILLFAVAACIGVLFSERRPALSESPTLTDEVRPSQRSVR